MNADYCQTRQCIITIGFSSLSDVFEEEEFANRARAPPNAFLCKNAREFKCKNTQRVNNNKFRNIGFGVRKARSSKDTWDASRRWDITKETSNA
ncbi:hypothetical protein RUM44_009692 [Polyplax serrata]|uniref:Uncharacterized protein n=1 Tax=Polyplax serrata TaxID=468196 RepID=A0ABR1ATF6_POLSC